MSIPARLKRARLDAGLGHRAIIARLRAGCDGQPPYNMSLGTLWKWEQEGHQSYDGELLARVCKMCGITVDSLTTAPEPQCAATYAQAHSAGAHDAQFERRCPLCKEMIAR